MEIKSFKAGPLEANNYLLTDNGESVLVDCSEDLGQENVKYILLTHAHFDHVLGVNSVRERTGAKVLIYKDEVETLNQMNDIMGFFGLGNVEKPVYDEVINDGDIIKFGSKEIKVIHTPGHTKGGVSYLVDDKLFSGDTLFRGSVGRCDLPGSDFEKMQESITKLFKLPDETQVYPGHDATTTISYEKKYNDLAV